MATVRVSGCSFVSRHNERSANRHACAGLRVSATILIFCGGVVCVCVVCVTNVQSSSGSRELRVLRLHLRLHERQRFASPFPTAVLRAERTGNGAGIELASLAGALTAATAAVRAAVGAAARPVAGGSRMRTRRSRSAASPPRPTATARVAVPTTAAAA